MSENSTTETPPAEGLDHPRIVRRCCDCQFYFEDRCRRYPPVFTGLDTDENKIVDFPQTLPTRDWCGEFQPNAKVLAQPGENLTPLQ